MLYGHEPQFDTLIAAPQGPTPLWCKVALVCAMVSVILVVTHHWWSKLL